MSVNRCYMYITVMNPENLIKIYLCPNKFTLKKVQLHLHQSLGFSIEAGSVLASIIFIYSLIRWKNKTHNKPPQPSGSWPFVGHLPLIGSHPHITLGNLADQYGPIFMLKLGVKRALVVSSGEMAKECLVIKDKVFANRPHTMFVEHIAYNSAMFGFSPLGEYWRVMRKITNTELLSKRSVDRFKHVRISELRSAMKTLLAAGSEPVDMKQWFNDMVMNTTVRLISGKSFKEIYKVEEEYNRYAKAMEEFFELAGAFVPVNVLPYLKWFDIGGYNKRIKAVAKEIECLAQMWLEELRTRRSIQETKESTNFMDAMLETFAKGQENHFSYDVDTIIKANCMFIILAATDTTATTLTWALALLLNNKHVLIKIQAELDTIVGKERQVQESDLKSLVYLEVVIKEILRLYPPGPLSVPRESVTDCTINGYHIPAGTHLFVNLYKLHRDPKAWENPLEFYPERFMTTSKDYDYIGVDYEYIPFGSGRRMCPGVSLALQMLRLTLANLLHVFDLSTPLNEAVDMTEGVGLTNPKATPLEVILTGRLPHETLNNFYYN